MTCSHPNGGHPLADLDPTPGELDTLAGVMAEVYGDGGLDVTGPPRPDPDQPGMPGDGGEDDSPWHDEAGLAYELELAGDPAGVGYLLDMASAADAQRLAEGEQPLPGGTRTAPPGWWTGWSVAPTCSRRCSGIPS